MKPVGLAATIDSVPLPSPSSNPPSQSGSAIFCEVSTGVGPIIDYGRKMAN